MKKEREGKTKSAFERAKFDSRYFIWNFLHLEERTVS